MNPPDRPSASGTILLHLDTDSPQTLLRFWGLHEAPDYDADLFYRRALGRALECFGELGVPATFFCIGKEMHRVPSAGELLTQAFRAGHELANHTWTHPYDFARHPEAEVRTEIRECSDWIRGLTGRSPIGFRAPGYSVNSSVLDILEEQGFRYDSSLFHSWINPLLDAYPRLIRRRKTGSAGFAVTSHAAPPRAPYFPSRDRITVPGPRRNIVEIPILNSRLGLPFYCNLHLTAGSVYRDWDVKLLDRPAGPYLFHLIEFCDLRDGLPAALKVHPNVSTPVEKKIAHIKQTLRLFKKRFRVARTQDFVEEAFRK